MENAPITSPGPVESGLSRQELDAVRARRASLRRAAAGVRDELGAPDGPGDLAAALDRLAEVWRAHTAGTESPDGVLAQIVGDSPRLVPAVDRLRRQHAEVAAALQAVRAGAAAGEAPGPALTAVLDSVERHRRDGRELLHDAYQVDLGLGE